MILYKNYLSGLLSIL